MIQEFGSARGSDQDDRQNEPVVAWIYESEILTKRAKPYLER